MQLHYSSRLLPGAMRANQTAIAGRGMLRRLALWRRAPGAPRSAKALRVLATLGLVLPLLAAVATLYTTQIVPDFDDYDWDGPDDDAWDDRKLTSIAPHLSGHDPARIAGILPTGFDRYGSASARRLEETQLAPPVVQRPRDAVSSRGPPSGTNTNRGVRHPGRRNSPAGNTSSNRTAFEVEGRHHGSHQENGRASERSGHLDQRADGRALHEACPGPNARYTNNTPTLRRRADHRIPASGEAGAAG